jgi:hypothetical protein
MKVAISFYSVLASTLLIPRKMFTHRQIALAVTRGLGYTALAWSNTKTKETNVVRLRKSCLATPWDSIYSGDNAILIKNN